MHVGMAIAVDCASAGCVLAGVAAGRVVFCGRMVGEAEELDEDAQADTMSTRNNAEHA